MSPTIFFSKGGLNVSHLLRSSGMVLILTSPHHSNTAALWNLILQTKPNFTLATFHLGNSSPLLGNADAYSECLCLPLPWCQNSKFCNNGRHIRRAERILPPLVEYWSFILINILEESSRVQSYAGWSKSYCMKGIQSLCLHIYQCWGIELLRKSAI